jgi:hypothetical protein
MTARQHLPNRRGHEVVAFEHGGIRYVAGIGRFGDGRLAEVFLNGAKCGTDLDTAATTRTRPKALPNVLITRKRPVKSFPRRSPSLRPWAKRPSEQH